MKIIKKIIGIIILLSLLPLVLLSIQLVVQQPIPYIHNTISNIYLQPIVLGYIISLCLGSLITLAMFAMYLIDK